MNNIMYIKLSSGKLFNLLKDKLTAQDMRYMSGEEVRKIESMLEEIAIEKGCEEAEKIFKNTEFIISYL